MTPHSYHRLDANHKAIKAAVEAHGWCWEDTAGSNLGYDALITSPDGRIVRLEIKDGSKPPSAQKLTPHERRTHEKLANFGGIQIVTSVEDVEGLCQT